jgi:hypothetical protein
VRKMVVGVKMDGISRPEGSNSTADGANTTRAVLLSHSICIELRSRQGDGQRKHHTSRCRRESRCFSACEHAMVGL